MEKKTIGGEGKTTEYQTLIQCEDCGNVQPFNGKLKPRAHTRCSACKKDLYVIKNIVPTDYNDNADKVFIQGLVDTFTDIKGNIYVESADGKPTTIDLSILRAFYKVFTGRAHRGTKEDLLSLIIVYLRSELGKL